MLLRLLSILFPIVAIVAIGVWLGRRHRPDFSDVNRLNLDLFVPALIFVSLAEKPLDLAAFGAVAGGGMAIIFGCGLVALALSRPLGIQRLTLVPPMMFNNSGNLGLPLALLAWGESAMPAAILLFAVQTGLQFSLGAWMLDPHTKLHQLWRVPVLAAAAAGLAAGATRLEIWPPLLTALHMVGDISIPLMLLSLGMRLGQSQWHDLGVAGMLAFARPLVGFFIGWAYAWLMQLPPQQAALLMVFGALPPAVMNYLFAERYGQEPERVAAIVLVGNLAAVAVLPVALAVVLEA